MAGLAGYYLYYGDASGAYTNRVDAGIATSVTLSNLPPGITYYFAVSDYTASGLESLLSNEASYTATNPITVAPPLVMDQPTNMAVNAGNTAILSASVSDPSASVQWLKNGTNALQDSATVTGATTPTLIINNVQDTDAANYTLQASNLAGTNTSSAAWLTVLHPPTITVSPVSRTNTAGTTATFSVGATGVSPFRYQWQFNGNNLPGATLASLALTNLQLSNAGSYGVQVANNSAAALSKIAVLGVVPDQTPPTVVIISPAANATITSNSITATGAALDNVRVTNVWGRLNEGPWLPVTTTNNWRNWSISWNGGLLVGTNTLSFQGADWAGNRSPLNVSTVRKFFFAVPSTLSLSVNDPLGGATSTNVVGGVAITNGAVLMVGRSYTVTALPSPGYVFTNWLVGSASSPFAKLTFTMRTNLALVANFIRTPFKPNVTGVYNGLFYETGGVAWPSSGFLTLTVSSNGLFNGRLYIAGASFPFYNAMFDAAGRASITVLRSATHQSALGLNLQIDLTGNSGTVYGAVSSLDSAWYSPALCYHAAFGSNNPAPYVGKYTFVVPGSPDPTIAPGGDGYAAVTVNSNGVVTLTGRLGDGNLEVQGCNPVYLGQNGQWPLYLPYSKSTGAMLGWLNLTNIPGVETNLAGTVAWTKPAGGTSPCYPGGFTNSVDVVGSGYLTPPANTRVLNLTQTQLIFAGADLYTPLTNMVKLTANNTVVFSPPVLSFSLAPANGTFSGRFVNSTTGQTNTFAGALLQNGNFGAGEFQSVTNTGSVYFGD